MIPPGSIPAESGDSLPTPRLRHPAPAASRLSSWLPRLRRRLLTLLLRLLPPRLRLASLLLFAPAPSLLPGLESSASFSSCTARQIRDWIGANLRCVLVLLGSIDDNFMDLPAEVLRTAMRKHQKYFALSTPDGKLVSMPFNSSTPVLYYNVDAFKKAGLDEVRFFAIFKPECDIFQKAFLVSFDGEMIMGMTLRHQVLGNFALGQQSIGGHILAFNIDGIEHGDGHLDFVGAFDFFIVFYRKGPNFFWV